jgi:NifU-like protein
MHIRTRLWQNRCVSIYPAKVNERFMSASSAGTSAEADVGGTSASFVCGSFVSLSLRIEEEAGVIEEARFRTNGCGFMIAASDVLCAWLGEKTFADLHGLNESDLMHAVIDELGEFPPDRRQCAEIAFEALRAAMAAYRTRRIEEFQGEKALICTCFGISEETIVTAISDNSITEVDAVADVCRAGSGCGSCRMLIHELIDAHANDPG